MKKYFMGTIALLMAFAFTASKQIPQDDVTLIFTGTDQTDQSQVENEELWRVGTPSCEVGIDLACSINTNMSNTKLLAPTIRVLDDTKVILGSSISGAGYYIPSKASGTGDITVPTKEED